MLDVVGEAALRAVLLTTLVQCAVWLLRLRSARLLLAAWTVVLIASLAMPLLPQMVPVRLTIDSTVSRPLADGVVDLLRQPALEGLAAARDDSVAEPDAPSSLRRWLTTIYVVVGCGILLRTLLGLGLSLRLLARATPTHPAWAAGHRVRTSPDITGPVTIAHIILLPTDAMDWPAEMQQAVLAHERAHVARWDFVLLVVSQLNRALFWCNPLSWWLHRRLIMLTELASDDQAMAVTTDRLRYAEILLEIGRGPVDASRGPAMARSATLVRRIERIVQGETKPYRISRPQQVLLTAGVAGLSLAVASLTPDLTSPAAITLAASERTGAPEAVVIPDSSAGPTDEAGGRAAISAAPARLGETSVPPPLPARSDRHLLARAAIALPPVPAAVRRKPMATGQAGSGQAGSGQAGSGQGLHTKPLDEARELSTVAAGVNVTARAGAAAAHGQSSSREQVVREPLPLNANLEEIVGRTCTGTIAVGPRAWRSYGKQPDVAAGELVPARAQFFRRADGTAWVRFNAFGQPPLDLPARLARNGVTWTGQYGISYALQASGGNQLAGLAALIANDSAGLHFACEKSAGRLL